MHVETIVAVGGDVDERARSVDLDLVVAGTEAPLEARGESLESCRWHSGVERIGDDPAVLAVDDVELRGVGADFEIAHVDGAARVDAGWAAARGSAGDGIELAVPTDGECLDPIALAHVEHAILHHQQLARLDACRRDARHAPGTERPVAHDAEAIDPLLACSSGIEDRRRERRRRGENAGQQDDETHDERALIATERRAVKRCDPGLRPPDCDPRMRRA